MLAEPCGDYSNMRSYRDDEAGEKIVHIHTENVAVARKYFTLLEKHLI